MGGGSKLHGPYHPFLDPLYYGKKLEQTAKWNYDAFYQMQYFTFHVYYHSVIKTKQIKANNSFKLVDDENN